MIFCRCFCYSSITKVFSRSREVFRTRATKNLLNSLRSIEGKNFCHYLRLNGQTLSVFPFRERSGEEKVFLLTKRLNTKTNGSREMNAHNLKIVKLYSRTENYTAKRKMNFSNSMFFPHRPFPFAGLFSRHFTISYLFCPNFFVFLLVRLLLAFRSFSCLVLGERESTFTLNFL